MRKNKIISEKYIIHKYLRNLHYNKIETFNFKNDAAYIKVPKNKQLVVTNDTILESTDFFKNDPPESIANKIVTCNLSDISSMGASPYAYTLSLCLPGKITDTWLTKFTKKLKILQKKYNFFLIGGDLSKSNKIIISSNFFGFVSKGKILNRTSAKVNDDIWVTGNLGESSIGLAIRKKKIRVNNIIKKYFLSKYLFPRHCFIGDKIVNLATSAIDMSDGFYGDLESLVNEKKIGASINSSLIPFSFKTKQLITNKIINFNYLLSAGDDYELLFTAQSRHSSTISRMAIRNNIKGNAQSIIVLVLMGGLRRMKSPYLSVKNL